MEKILVLGATKGLGAAAVDEFSRFRCHLFLVGRTEKLLQNQALKLCQTDTFAEYQKCDVAKYDDQEKLFKKIEEFKPDRILNFIGGGPYGPYVEKNWKDHQWALEVSFLFPARLIHFCLGSKALPNLRQIVVTGSSVAEDKPDPYASSYCAAKHALKGLITSLHLEHPNVDLRLYSPPYMDTSLLPTNAWPRKEGFVYSPKIVAQHMVRWILSSSDGKFHSQYQGELNV